MGRRATSAKRPAGGKAPTLGAFLKAARLARGLSQNDLALRAGVPQTTIGSIEAEISRGAFDTVRRLARGLGMGVAEFDLALPEPDGIAPEALARPVGRPAG